MQFGPFLFRFQQTHIIYDHLDVIVHPLAFHLTEGLAVAFWVSPGSVALRSLVKTVCGVASSLPPPPH